MEMENGHTYYKHIILIIDKKIWEIYRSRENKIKLKIKKHNFLLLLALIVTIVLAFINIGFLKDITDNKRNIPNNIMDDNSTKKG